MNIISGLLKHKSGSIYINEKKLIFLITLIGLKISYVSQNVNIFNDTIYNNISYNFHDSLFISNKKIQNILKDLNLNEFIKKKKSLMNLVKILVEVNYSVYLFLEHFLKILKLLFLMSLLEI